MQTMGDLPGERELRDFLLYVSSTRSLVDMVEGAASFTVHVSTVMRSTYERLGDEELVEFDAGSVASMAQIASTELTDGFPLLHGHTLVGLWGALEACVEGMIVSWLGSRPQAEVADYLKGVKCSLTDFLSRDGDDRWQWVLVQVENSTASALRSGIGQFESVLSKVGLDGPVDSNLRDVLFIAKAIRNLFAHRGGRADARFLDTCPAFGASIGAPVAVGRDQLTAAYTAMVMYVELVFERVRSALGEPSRDVSPPPWVASTANLRQMMIP